MRILRSAVPLFFGMVFSLTSWAQLNAPAPPAGIQKPHAVAPEAHAVSVVLTQHKVTVDERGKEKLVEAQSVRPNDIIEYRAVYKNVSNRPVKQLTANLPIPSGLEYLPVSAQPRAGVQFATTSGVFAAEPLQRRLSSGASEPLPYNEYRQARWVIDELAPGASTTVTARVKVEAVVPLADASSAARATRP